MAFKYSNQVSSPVSKSKVKSPFNDAYQMNAINNNVLRASPRRQANQFAEWYKNLIDNDRGNFGMYMADDSIFQWFGKTVKTKKKIADFLRYDMHCTSHRFTAVEASGPITVRGEAETNRKQLNFDDSFEELATPLDAETPEKKTVAKLFSPNNKRSRAMSSSPEWEKSSETKRIKNEIKKSNDSDELGSFKRLKRKKLDLGKTDKELTPSTSKVKKRPTVNESMDYILELPRFYIEAKCIIEFMRTRNKRGAEVMKWERQCKVQVAYSEDPMYTGEYIIWTVVYSDNNKCRRNLLAEFDAISVDCAK